MAALSSTQSGNLDDPNTFGVGSIGSTDTFTLNNGHTVTAVNNQTLGSSPATGGTAAVRVRQGAVFTISGAVLTLNGDIRMDQGSTINANSGTWQFNPGSGVVYGVVDVDTGINTPAFTVGATYASQFTIKKNSGAAGTVSIVFDEIAPNIAFTGLILDGLGSATVDAFQYTGANGRSIAWTDTVVMPNCGRTNISLSSSTTSTIDFLNVAILGNINSNGMLRLIGSGAKSSGTRSMRNVGIYHTSNIGNEISMRDLTWNGGMLIDQNIYDDRTEAQGWRFSRIFLLNSVSINGQFGPNRNSDSSLTDSAFIADCDNPHYSSTADNIAGTKNTISDCVFDGGNFTPLTDGGDGFVGGGSIDFIRNIICNHAGVGLTGLNTSLRATIRRLTVIGTDTKGANIGETTGDALMLTEFKDCILYNQNSGLGFDDGHVPQTNAAINYNRYYGQTGTTNIMSGGNKTYVTVPNTNRVGNTTATAGTNATTLIASGATFVTAGVIPGDFVRRPSDGLFARVASVDSQTQLTLADGGISGLATNDTVTVRYNIWSTSGRKYGDAGYGDHDSYGDPKLRDPTISFKSYDSLQGGGGTYAHFKAEIFKSTGFDTAGAKASFNQAFSIDSVLAYYRNGATPTDESLKGAGDPANGSTDVGAVTVQSVLPPVPAANNPFYQRLVRM